MLRRPTTHGAESSLNDLRMFFEDDHVHMALIVSTSGTLLTAIQRADLTNGPDSTAVVELGTLSGRTVGSEVLLSDITALLLRENRRRLAVVDNSGRLLGLICLKRDGSGFCSDEGVAERRAAQDRDHSIEQTGQTVSHLRNEIHWT